MNQRILVVGGGLCGIVAAHLLAKKGHHIDLIDASEQIGGLMAGVQTQNGDVFDNGARSLVSTGIKDVDKFLFEEYDASNYWNEFDFLPSYCFFNGQLSPLSFVDARLLPKDIYQDGLNQMLALPPLSRECKNLDEVIIGTFGKIFADYIFHPALFKLTGSKPKDLGVSAHLPFALNRLICGSEEDSIKIKSISDWNDSRFAFHNPQQNKNQLRYLYPKKGGLLGWINKLEKQLKNSNVSIKCNTTVDKIDYISTGNISVKTSSGIANTYNSIIWTISPHLLLRFFGETDNLSKPDTQQKIRFNDIYLHHFSFKGHGNNLNRGHYITNYDKEYDTFRVNLYDNLEQNMQDKSKFTVEQILINGAEMPPSKPEKILNELIKMNVVPESLKIDHYHGFLLKKIMPVIDCNYLNILRANNSALNILPEDIILLGKSKFLINSTVEMLRDTHSTLSSL